MLFRSVLRGHIKNGTELGKIANEYISQGQLIPDDLMVSILADVLDANEDAKKGVIFDGFPRTINQAKALKDMLEDRNTEIHAVVGLEVEDEELIDRLIKRGKDSGRADDNLETIQKRLHVYHSQTKPLQDYYINEGKYLKINGTGSIDDIFNRTVESIDAKK